MLGDGIGDRDVKAFVREREICGILFLKMNMRCLFLCEIDKIRISVNTRNFGGGIPSRERFGKCAGTASDLKDAFSFVNIKGTRVFFTETVRKTQCAALIKRFFFLHIGRPFGVHKRGILSFFCSVYHRFPIASRNRRLKNGMTEIMPFHFY